MLRRGDGLTKTERLLTEVVDYYENEDKFARDRKILMARKLKLFWDNFQQVWYSEVAHDWRVNIPTEGSDEQSYYDKPINIFRSYLESVIAALSVTVPPLTCYPDDADNELDLTTAKAGNKIAQLIYRHNNVSLLWVHALFIHMTEGMVGCYNYPKTDEKYGTYTENKFKSRMEETESLTCPNCGYVINERAKVEPTPEILMEEEGFTVPPMEQPEMETGAEIDCPSCGETILPEYGTDNYEIDELIEMEVKNKTRQCLEAYGGLYIKIPLSAKKPEDIFYVLFNCEVHEAVARAQYPDIRKKIQAGVTSNDLYGRWGRMSSQFAMSEAENLVTKRRAWLEPSAFECLNEEDCDHLKRKFPKGAHVCIINEELAEYTEEALDEYWTFTVNPLSDYMEHDPTGMLLVSVQELTNDLISLIVQTVEHGIPQTFADPNVLNFNKYRQSEAGPGFIFPAIPKSGKTMADSFYEVKTATLSPEIFPFAQYLQTLGQTVSGALPSLFGGQMEGSRTASEYSMSRNQALQRLQCVWKMLIIWWKEIFSKAIVHYIQSIKDDEKFVERDQAGNFVNILIAKAELEGHIGSVELEANENLPLTWVQRKDVIMQLMGTQNQQLLEALASPENLPIMQDALGLSDFYLPGEDDRAKQYDEIKALLASAPMEEPPSEDEILQAMANGLPEPQPREVPSVNVEPLIDNHHIQYEICRKWLVSEAGRLTKIENEDGYKNVLLHALEHKYFVSPPMPAMPSPMGAADPTKTQEAPITGEPNAVA